jgi:hypothetical protein
VKLFEGSDETLTGCCSEGLESVDVGTLLVL